MVYKEAKSGFILPIKIKELIKLIKSVMINIPNSERILKDNIIQESYSLLKQLYIANSVSKKHKQEYINNMFGILSMIDYYIEECYLNKYISERQCRNIGMKMNLIFKLLYGWQENESNV